MSLAKTALVKSAAKFYRGTVEGLTGKGFPEGVYFTDDPSKANLDYYTEKHTKKILDRSPDYVKGRYSQERMHPRSAKILRRAGFKGSEAEKYSRPILTTKQRMAKGREDKIFPTNQSFRPSEIDELIPLRRRLGGAHVEVDVPQKHMASSGKNPLLSEFLATKDVPKGSVKVVKRTKPNIRTDHSQPWESQHALVPEDVRLVGAANKKGLSAKAKKIIEARQKAMSDAGTTQAKRSVRKAHTKKLRELVGPKK